MKQFYTINKLMFKILICFLLSLYFSELRAQNFVQRNLDFNGFDIVNMGTSIMYGPDDRLYVAERSGKIKIYTIERTELGDYKVIASEVLSDIQEIQNHNDDGSLISLSTRQLLGITIVGTADNPVIYATSSDIRIGGGGGGATDRDKGIDTNSGTITRFTRNGSSWDVVDIVRGLPRSEENHSPCGLEFRTINNVDYLIVTQGGNTNAGAPSNNFARTTEYALTAALLSVNLTQLETLPVLNDNGRNYLYDLPTLDDPTRANVNGITDRNDDNYNGIDINDPFGGNDGLNQAILDPNGPVQIFAPGFRHSYDFVITESGAVYVTDNGANGGWGGFPENEGGGNVTNEYNPNEPGSSSIINGERVNNTDHLSLVTTDIQNYTFGSFYAGHPNPVRANPLNAGLYTRNGETTVFRTLVYDPDGSTPNSTTDSSIALPANWPPISDANANPIEGDWRGPGMENPDGPNDVLVTIWGTNTNGIDEYTATNFNGAMQGDLIAGKNGGILRRVELKDDGSLETLTESFASGIGGNALGVTCNSDIDIFPGTIWVAPFNNTIVVLEPQDFLECILKGEPDYDSSADYDQDGYTNEDEENNGTDACNGGSQPNDFDKVAGGILLSDLNDNDDDNDGILDKDDVLQLGNITSLNDAFVIPVTNELFSDTTLGGYLGLGFTGMMNNGDANLNWLNWLDKRDNPEDPNPNDVLGGAIGAMTMQMTSGTAFGTANTQEKAFQYGVQLNQNFGDITVSGGIINFNAPLQLYGNTATPEGELGFFIGDGTQSNYIKFVIHPSKIIALQEIDDIPQIAIETLITTGERPNGEIQFFFEISTSTGEVSLEYVFDNEPREILGVIQAEGTVLEAIQQNSKELIVGLIGTSNQERVELEGTWDFLNVTGNGLIAKSEEVLYRVNTGGAKISAIDGEIDWDADTISDNSIYLIDAGTNSTASFSMGDYTPNVDLNKTPESIYNTERWTGKGTSNMTYSFPVEQSGKYEVRLYMGNGFSGTSNVGERIFDVVIEGQVFTELDNIDLSRTYGHQVGTVISNVVTVSDGIIDISFIHGVENPLINGIEIIDNSIENTIEVTAIDNQFNTVGDILDGSLAVVAIGGDGNLSFSAVGLPSGVFIEPTNGQIGGEIALDVITSEPYNVIVTVDDNDTNKEDAKRASFTWTIQENEIEVVAIDNQVSTIGDILNGSLVAMATGGDGNLSFSAVGLPSGVFIESTNGQIGGEIALDAIVNEPYNVIVTVGDSDSNILDAKTISFTWTIEEIVVIPNPTVAVTSYVLIDADSDIDLFTITNGMEIAIESLPTLNLSIRAEVTESTESVSMNLTGPLTVNRTENFSPYALFGDANKGANYIGGDFLIGDYTINSQAFSGKSLTGDQGTGLSVDFKILEPSESETIAVTSYVLIDADSDIDLFTITDGMEIAIESLPTLNLSIRAEVTESTESVSMNLTGPLTINKTENFAPYALFGDMNRGTNYGGGDFLAGEYTINSQAFSRKSLAGDQGVGLSVDFTIIDTPVSTSLLAKGIEVKAPIMKVYPNPIINNEVTISFNSSVVLKRVLIFDSSGKLIETFNPNTIKGGQTSYSIDVDYLMSGIYSLQVMDINGITYYKRIIKKLDDK